LYYIVVFSTLFKQAWATPGCSIRNILINTSNTNHLNNPQNRKITDNTNN